MSSVLNPINSNEIQADKPVIETAADVEQTNLNTNDTNSTTQNEVSPLKRNLSELIAADEKTPIRSKKSRVDRFQEESKALLKSYGLEDGPGSEKRLTRSRTRGTPVSTPLTKPEPVKQTTGAKRGRKPSEKKEQNTDDDGAVKTTAKKGRGRPKQQPQQEMVVDNDENSTATEELQTKVETSNVANDENESSEINKGEKKSEDDLVTSTEENKSKVSEIVTKDATNSDNIQKEELKVQSTNLKDKKPVENSKETSNSEVKVTTNDTTKVGNNLPSNNNQQSINDQVEQTTKSVEQTTEKVVESSKLSDSIEKKQEVQTA